LNAFWIEAQLAPDRESFSERKNRRSLLFGKSKALV
jgi:hypothetical protein